MPLVKFFLCNSVPSIPIQILLYTKNLNFRLRVFLLEMIKLKKSVLRAIKVDFCHSNAWLKSSLQPCLLPDGAIELVPNVKECWKHSNYAVLCFIVMWYYSLRSQIIKCVILNLCTCFNVSLLYCSHWANGSMVVRVPFFCLKELASLIIFKTL